MVTDRDEMEMDYSIKKNDNTFCIYDFERDYKFPCYSLNKAAQKINEGTSTKRKKGSSNGVQDKVKRGTIYFIKYNGHILIPEWSVWLEQRRKSEECKELKRIPMDMARLSLKILDKMKYDFDNDFKEDDFIIIETHKIYRIEMENKDQIMKAITESKEGRFQKRYSVPKRIKGSPHRRVREYLEYDDFQIIIASPENPMERNIYGRVAWSTNVKYEKATIMENKMEAFKKDFEANPKSIFTENFPKYHIPQPQDDEFFIKQKKFYLRILEKREKL